MATERTFKVEAGIGVALMGVALLAGWYVMGKEDDGPKKPRPKPEPVKIVYEQRTSSRPNFDPVHSSKFPPFHVRDRTCRVEFEVLHGGEVPEDAYVRMTLDPWGGIGTLDVIGKGMPGSPFEKCLRRTELSRAYQGPVPESGVIEIPLTP